MNPEYIIYGIIGIVLLYFVLKIFKWPLKIIFNGILGVIMLYAVNIIIPYLSSIGITTSFRIPINIITALIAGFLGVPGVIFLVIFFLFMI